MTREEAFEKVRSDWEAQCQKLEVAGYSTPYPNTPLGDDELILLAQLYLIDTETAQKYLRELALAFYSNTTASLKEVTDELREEVFDARDDRLEDLHLEARRTYSSNYELVESLSKLNFLSETPLYQWMGVSRAFPARNRMDENEGSSEKIGTTPSLKTLWQMGGALGLHPILFLVDHHVINTLVQLTDLDEIGDPEKIEQSAKEALQQVRYAQKRFDQANQKAEIDEAADHWWESIVGFAESIGCGSPGGKLGARIGTDYAMEEEKPEALIAVTYFGHSLGEVTPEWMISIDAFQKSSSDSEGYAALASDE